MNIQYDKNVDALAIHFNQRRCAESDEVAPGIILDYDRRGKVVGIEILDASRQFSREFKSGLERRRSIPVVLRSARPAEVS
ncbi:MAG: DUF2283 domain-containing protein [Candidatus Liptonbacteria bacterium]|nr:DUF2283 domain-containing protein [Candidatus Liptonbacteria bacterium]